MFAIAAGARRRRAPPWPSRARSGRRGIRGARDALHRRSARSALGRGRAGAGRWARLTASLGRAHESVASVGRRVSSGTARAAIAGGDLHARWRRAGKLPPVRWPLALSLLLAAAVAAALPAAAGATVRVIGPAERPLPGPVAGLSLETDLIPGWFAPGSCRSAARTVLKMAGPALIRIGGNSQDRLWPTAPLPPGQRQVANAPFFHAVNCLGATGAPVLLGLNLLGRSPQATGDLLAAAGRLVPRQRLTIAIGNEPNLYGSRLPRRYAGYVQFYGQVLTALRQRLGGLVPPIVGPDAAAYRWIPETARFVRQVHPAKVDVHLYGINGCRRGVHATAEQLLSPAASTQLINNLAPVVRAAREQHIPAQITELNSVACRGERGVSNTPAAALWALQVLGDATTAGFSRLAFHSSQSVYDAFVVRPGGTVQFRPLWTAMLLADALWPKGTRALHVNGTTPPGVGVWAARRPDGSTALLAVNPDATHTRTVVGRRLAPRARVGRLEPLGRFAVALDGRQLVWSRGRPGWRGRARVERTAARGGRLRIQLAPRTAAWATLGATRGRTPATMTGG